MGEHNAKEKLDVAKNLVINSIAETMDLYGVTPSVGRLYGAMYFQQEPMSLDEMKDELGMSKPSMSTAVRKLQENEMVQKAWVRGSRKDLYVAEKDFFKSFAQFFCKKWEKEVLVNLEATIKAEKLIDEIKLQEDLPDDLKEEIAIIEQQLKDSKDYYHWLRALVESFRTGEIYKTVPKPNGGNVKV